MPTKPLRPRSPRSGASVRLPIAPPEGYRHPEFPALVWRGSNWVVDHREEPFRITDEMAADRDDR